MSEPDDIKMTDCFNLSMELFHYIDDGGDDPEEIGKLWHAAFEAVLMREGFNRKAIDCMWKNDQLVLHEIRSAS